MSEKKATYLLLDTSYLRQAGSGFDSPNFRKLLHFSKHEILHIFVPHIVWEERRTQLRETALTELRALRTAFDRVNGQLEKNVIFGGLTPPVLSVWSELDQDKHSKLAMTTFATENKIKIVSLAADHADRAWQRYFDTELPFSRDEKRENRRKDIPDSWIFETAIDLKSKYPTLIALCLDDKLSIALASIKVTVYKDDQQVLDKIEEELAPKAATNAPEPATSTPESAPVESANPDDGLKKIVAQAQEQITQLETKVLGFIGYLTSPSKEQLFSLLAQSGISIEVAKNIADRLALAGLITDTGNHYLPKTVEAGALAAALVEPEIIKLLEA